MASLPYPTRKSCGTSHLETQAGSNDPGAIRPIIEPIAADAPAMQPDPNNRPQLRPSFLPKNLPAERWGLLMPAAVALALLLILAIVFVRMTS